MGTKAMETNSNKIVLISGGSKGLGATLLNKLTAEGYVIATFSRSENDFIRKMRERDSQENKFFYRVIDSKNIDALKNFVRDVCTRFGRVDILINNAALLVEGVLATMKNSDIESLIATNILSTIFLTKFCVKNMLLKNEGRIINISSINAIRGYAGVSVYAATKAAIDAFSKSLSRELGPSNIIINSVIPGFFDSHLTKDVSENIRWKIKKKTPLQKLGTADEIANVVMFLCSDKSKFITGQNLVVDGGITV
jgi:3-oxoacyl-[acyl-carrier protein] reductase